MAMSYHMDARIKQDRLNRWKEQRDRAELGHQQAEPADAAYNQKMDKVLSTDPGQFNQISETGEKKFKNWNPPKKERPAEPTPKPPPSSVRNLNRDSVYKILHPYEFH